MRPAIEAVRATGTAVAEVALCYTADLVDPAETLYTLDYYLRPRRRRSSTAGAHVLAIKDMAGLLRPRGRPAARHGAARALRPARCTCTPTTPPAASSPRCSRRSTPGWTPWTPRGAPMAGTTSQPPMSALVAALAHTERDPGFDLRAVMDLEPYWEAVRRVYAPFESGLPSPTGRVYDHEIPGGQLSNLRQQAIALGLGEKFEQIEAMYAAADRILGRLVKVTPSSKVVGDLALHLVAVGADPDEFAEHPERFDIPDSVIGFLGGELGDPPGGWPEPFRTRALEGRQRARAGRSSCRRRTTAGARRPTVARTLNRLLFPGPTSEFAARARDVRRRLRARHGRLPLRAAARRGARRRARARRAADRRARGRSATSTSAGCAR